MSSSPMSSALWRRVFLTIYVAGVVLLSFWIVEQAFAPSEMIQIDDRDAVMRRRTSSVLTSITIDDPVWEQVVISDHDFLYTISQRINAIPRVHGEFPGEAPGKLVGTMIFADGSQESYSIGTVLTMDDEVYYSPEAQSELEEIHRALAAKLYTLPNLASFFRPNNQVLLTDGASTLTLSSENMGLVRRAIEGGELVEDLEEVSQTVGDRPPRFTVTVRDDAGVELLRLWVYANESTQVYDAYSSGQRLLLCFSGELVPLCQGILENGA